MAKANADAPKVFLVPDLMASEPVEALGMLQEHLAAERNRGVAGSVRERIEGYLSDPGGARKPPGEQWPGAKELARMSGLEKQQWLTWQGQHWLDSNLKKILGGKSPREVFKLDKKKRARPSTAARDRNICAEVLRLIERCELTRAEATERVAEAFSVSVAVVERATELWGWDARGKKERRRFVPLWEERLRHAGKLV
jgi:hypothetical protein